MKHVLLMMAALVGLAAPAQLKPRTADAIVQYFNSEVASLDHHGLNASQRLRPAEVESARAAVWRLWRLANAAAERQLPALAPLAEADSAVWALPDTLEPDARMAFYYGSKGESDTLRPLFVYMHGSGPRDREWSTGRQLGLVFDDAPSAYFIPRIPNEGEYYRWWQRAKQLAWETLLRRALASGQVDPERVYMFGISEGGYGSQRLASFYADYLAGAGPMAGGEPLRNAPVENCRNIAFSLRTGEKDYGFYRNMLTAFTAEAFDSVAALSPADDFRRCIELIPESGHGIDYRPTTPWLRQFSRRTHPLRVSWEDFAMDGRHRTGFHNIRSDRRPELPDTVRMHYELVTDTLTNSLHLTAELVTYTTEILDPNWGIPLRFSRTRTPAADGEVTLFIDPELIDLTRPVTVTVNGRTAFRGKVKADVRHLAESCALFGDPARLYPAAVTVRL